MPKSFSIDWTYVIIPGLTSQQLGRISKYLHRGKLLRSLYGWSVATGLGKGGRDENASHMRQSSHQPRPPDPSQHRWADKLPLSSRSTSCTPMILPPIPRSLTLLPSRTTTDLLSRVTWGLPDFPLPFHLPGQSEQHIRGRICRGAP